MRNTFPTVSAVTSAKDIKVVRGKSREAIRIYTMQDGSKIAARSEEAARLTHTRFFK